MHTLTQGIKLGLPPSAIALLIICSGCATSTPPPNLVPADDVPTEAVAPSHGQAFSLVYAAASTRHCDEQQIACFNRCWERYPPYPVERGNKGQYIYCTSKCLEEYMACVKDAEAKPRTFPSKKTALDWLEKHRTEIMVGTVIFVGGVVFIVGTGGAGALVLIPLATL